MTINEDYRALTIIELPKQLPPILEQLSTDVFDKLVQTATSTGLEENTRICRQTIACKEDQRHTERTPVEKQERESKTEKLKQQSSIIDHRTNYSTMTGTYFKAHVFDFGLAGSSFSKSTYLEVSCGMKRRQLIRMLGVLLPSKGLLKQSRQSSSTGRLSRGFPHLLRLDGPRHTHKSDYSMGKVGRILFLILYKRAMLQGNVTLHNQTRIISCKGLKELRLLQASLKQTLLRDMCKGPTLRWKWKFRRERHKFCWIEISVYQWRVNTCMLPAELKIVNDYKSHSKSEENFIKEMGNKPHLDKRHPLEYFAGNLNDGANLRLFSQLLTNCPQMRRYFSPITNSLNKATRFPFKNMSFSMEDSVKKIISGKSAIALSRGRIINLCVFYCTAKRTGGCLGIWTIVFYKKQIALKLTTTCTLPINFPCNFPFASCSGSTRTLLQIERNWTKKSFVEVKTSWLGRANPVFVSE
ncbi:hypothetical protein EGR_04761 [Echinococcus granulosus]|uniref:Uncharacterized protein n=1 Tax=Echinococcus granulosus TaxID=6210 RepID=W6V2Z9_ECHGR|nr:hypothetical protein EGR_04761 [Echinococcus granulosus]EUB60379.1 hypothetical protein EGR_04761 [Echinococcus granulosus]